MHAQHAMLVRPFSVAVCLWHSLTLSLLSLAGSGSDEMSSEQQNVGYTTTTTTTPPTTTTGMAAVPDACVCLRR